MPSPFAYTATHLVSRTSALAQVGHNFVFYKPEEHSRLEVARGVALRSYAARIQAHVRGGIAREAGRKLVDLRRQLRAAVQSKELSALQHALNSRSVSMAAHGTWSGPHSNQRAVFALPPNPSVTHTLHADPETLDLNAALIEEQRVAKSLVTLVQATDVQGSVPVGDPGNSEDAQAPDGQGASAADTSDALGALDTATVTDVLGADVQSANALRVKLSRSVPWLEQANSLWEVCQAVAELDRGALHKAMPLARQLQLPAIPVTEQLLTRCALVLIVPCACAYVPCVCAKRDSSRFSPPMCVWRALSLPTRYTRPCSHLSTFLAGSMRLSHSRRLSAKPLDGAARRDPPLSFPTPWTRWILPTGNAWSRGWLANRMHNTLPERWLSRA